MSGLLPGFGRRKGLEEGERMNECGSRRVASEIAAVQHSTSEWLIGLDPWMKILSREVLRKFFLVASG